MWLEQEKDVVSSNDGALKILAVAIILQQEKDVVGSKDGALKVWFKDFGQKKKKKRSCLLEC